jgi:hypothetical protein
MACALSGKAVRVRALLRTWNNTYRPRKTCSGEDPWQAEGHRKGFPDLHQRRPAGFLHAQGRPGRLSTCSKASLRTKRDAGLLRSATCMWPARMAVSWRQDISRKSNSFWIMEGDYSPGERKRKSWCRRPFYPAVGMLTVGARRHCLPSAHIEVKSLHTRGGNSRHEGTDPQCTGISRSYTGPGKSGAGFQ